MIVGLPQEIKEGEYRVGMTPYGVSALTAHGHTVLVETGAGEGCDFSDREYRSAGARIMKKGAEVWKECKLVVKVKEPLPEEYPYLREDLVLFTFLHLAANPHLTSVLLRSGITAIGYETVRTEDGKLPLLAPMSEVAGCLSVQKGAYLLEVHHGGRGVLIAGISGAPPAQVTVIGGGVAGINACRTASGMGARVTVLDISVERLQYLRDIFGGSISTLISSRGTIADCLEDSDMVIGAVLVPGHCAPRLITRSMVDAMPRGSVLVDISIDQGGIAETSRPTTHSEPSYMESGVVHCCITNLPAAVPRSSTLALANCTLPYVISMADKGVIAALEEDASLREGLNVAKGEVVHPGVRDSLQHMLKDKEAE